ncbi:MAG: hypothetical protein ACR2P4_08355 [Gammaproteobacteria bacterium]
MSKFPPIQQSLAEAAANIAALSRSQKEIKLLLKETAQQQKETAGQQKETDRLLKDDIAAVARLQEETALQMQETDKKLANVGIEVGGIGNADGVFFEDEVAEVIAETLRIGDIALDVVTPDIRSMAGNQFDLVGVNGKCVVLIEAKQTLHLRDVVRFAERTMPVFKADYSSQIKRKSVKGALIYRRLGNKERAAREALDRGLILVRAVGKNQLHQIKTMAEVSKPAREFKTAAK